MRFDAFNQQDVVTEETTGATEGVAVVATETQKVVPFAVFTKIGKKDDEFLGYINLNYGHVSIRGIRVIQKEQELSFLFPQYQRDEKWYNYVFLGKENYGTVCNELRNFIKNEVDFDSDERVFKSTKVAEDLSDDVTVTLNNIDKSGTRNWVAIATINYHGMSLQSIFVRKKKNGGGYWMSLPSNMRMKRNENNVLVPARDDEEKIIYDQIYMLFGGIYKEAIEQINSQLAQQ